MKIVHPESQIVSVEFPKYRGICVLKLLLYEKRNLMELKLQNDEGISPVKLLSNTKTHLLWDGRSRSDSESKIQVEDIWDFSTERFFILVEKFCQRYRTYKVRTPISHIQLECYHEFGFEKLSITVVDVEFSRRLETHLDLQEAKFNPKD